MQSPPPWRLSSFLSSDGADGSYRVLYLSSYNRAVTFCKEISCASCEWKDDQLENVHQQEILFWAVPGCSHRFHKYQFLTPPPPTFQKYRAYFTRAAVDGFQQTGIFSFNAKRDVWAGADISPVSPCWDGLPFLGDEKLEWVNLVCHITVFIPNWVSQLEWERKQL